MKQAEYFYFYIFMTALFSALIMVPFLRRWALDTGAVDTPDGRKVHSHATPRIGGIAISMAFLFSLLVHIDLSREVRGILAGALILFFTGLIDDLYGLTPRRKAVGELAACLIAMAIGRLWLTGLGDLFGFGPIDLPLWLGIPFTIFAVVGVINAVNLIDGLDGLAGGVSVIALTAFFLLAWQTENASAAAVCVALLGAVLGFLKYNFYPARIFMGDAGSLVVGFVLGFVAIMLTQNPGAGVSPMIPVMILGLPIVDTIWVMTQRIVKGKSPFAPDMTHVHHQFLNLGLQHRFTVLVIYSISLFWAVFALLFQGHPEYVLLSVFLVLTLACYLLLRNMLRHRDRFAFLSRDSARGWRDSDSYRRLAEMANGVIPLLQVVILAYFLLTAVLGGGGDPDLWRVGSVLLLAGVALLYISRDPRNDFLVAMLFFGTLLITFAAEKGGGRAVLAGINFDRLANLLLLAGAALIAVKIVFRRSGEFFLATVDYLLLSLAILFGIVLLEIGQSGDLYRALPKGIVLFLAVKTLAGAGPGRARLAVGGTLTVLLAVTAKSFLGL